MQVIDHIHEDDLQLYASGMLAKDRLLVVEAHMITCEGCASRLEEAAAFVAKLARLEPTATVGSSERRGEGRIPTSQTASLQVLRPLSLRRVPVQIADTSRSGLGLAMPVRLVLGSLVQIRVQETVVLGEIRYCVKVGGVFRAGVQVENIHTVSVPPGDDVQG